MFPLLKLMPLLAMCLLVYREWESFIGAVEWVQSIENIANKLGAFYDTFDMYAINQTIEIIFNAIGG